MMGSAAATSLGVIGGKSATAAQGDAPAGESNAGFLAALGAAVPAGAATPSGAAKLLPSTTEEGTPGEMPASELAAMIAALLQAAQPAGDAIAAGESDVDVAAQESAAPASGAAATAGTLLASVRAAIKGLAADAASGSDAGDADAQLWQALGVKSQADGAVPASGPQVGLRQLLQMMGQQAGQPSDAEVAQQPASTSPPDTAAASPAVKLAQGAADFAQAISTGAAAHGDQPAPVQPATTAPNSMLAAASANFASPAHQPAPASADPSPTLHAAVGTARWADELGSRLTLMTLRGQHEGSLNLTPEHLGPVEVRISVNQNTANVWFGAQHADARAAITEAMPRLRELLGEAGITLGQSGVSHQAPRQGSRSSEAQRHAVGSAAGVGENPAAAPAIARRIALGLVDTYV